MITLDKSIEQVKNCLLDTQGGNRINWTKAAKEIGLPKTTLWQIFEEGRSPTWKNLSKILEYTGCYLKCPPRKKKSAANSQNAVLKGKKSSSRTN